MTTSFDCVANLSEQELLAHFANLVARDRRTTAELLVAIAEIDERKIWAAHACSSMFTFCMERFHMSEQVTAKRLWAARTARRFPVILEMVARGELHLGAIHLLAKHLTDENHVRVLECATHKSSREVERLVAEIAPRADVPSRIRALPGPRGAVAAAPFVHGPGDAASLHGTSGAAPSSGGALVDRASSCGALVDRAPSGDAWVDGTPGGLAGRASSGNASTHRASSGGELEDSASSSPSSTNNEPASCACDRRTSADPDQTGRAGDARIPATPADSRAAAKPITPLSPRRYKIEITVDEATHDKLRSLQDLLAPSGTGRDPAAIISRAIDVLLVRTLARKAACTDRPKTRSAKPVHPMKPTTSAKTTADSTMPAEPACTDAPDLKKAKMREIQSRSGQRALAPPRSNVAVMSSGKRSRAIPAAVRREVWQRDSGRCCYVDLRGRRCRETSNIEFHHRTPFALGGPPTADNVELRCAAHNQFQADLDFGRSFMDARRGKVGRAPAFPGECRGRSPEHGFTLRDAK